METRFCGHKTGFNPTGENTCDPNKLGPPTTTFGGRPAVPAGPLKYYPGEVANISTGNRRLAKSHHGEGDACATVFKGSSAFGNGGPKASSGRKPGGMRGGKNMEMNRK
jgi:hypothetical protein